MVVLEGTDWDAEEARVRRLGQAIGWLTTAVKFRGAILWDEAFSALAERYPDVEVDEVVTALILRSDLGLCGMARATVDQRDYIISSDMKNMGDRDYLTDRVRKYQRAREDIEPYWPSEAEAASDTFYEATMERPEVRELIRYLDAHVPDGIDDMNYADNCWEYIASESLSSLGGVDPCVKSLEENLNFCDYPDRFFTLARAALEALPDRLLAGHSPASLKMLQEGSGGRR